MTIQAPASVPDSPRFVLLKRLPGLALALLVAASALLLAAQPWARDWGLSALTLAIAGGLVLGHTVYPALRALRRQTALLDPEPGIQWSKQHLLRLGIVLFGLRLSFQD